MLRDNFHILFLTGWAFKEESLLPLAQRIENALNCPCSIKETCSTIPIPEKIDLPSNTIIIGWSIGAILALEIFFKYAEKICGMVLLSGTASFCNNNPLLGIQKVNVRAMKIALQHSPQKVIDDFLMLAAFPSTPHPQIKNTTIDLDRKENVSSLIKGLDYLMEKNFSEMLNQVLCPTMIVAASQDKVIPCTASKKMSESISGSHFIEIENKGHLFPLLEPENIAKIITEWITLRSYAAQA